MDSGVDFFQLSKKLLATPAEQWLETLSQACATGDDVTVQRMLSQPNAMSVVNSTTVIQPAILAIQHNHLKCFQLLAKHQKNNFCSLVYEEIGTWNRPKFIPDIRRRANGHIIKMFFAACKNGHLNLLRYLSTYCCVYHHDYSNMLIEAASNDHLPVVAWLFSTYADSLCSRSIWEAINIASANNHESVVHFLLDKAAWVSYDSDELRYMPYVYAVMYDNQRLIRRLEALRHCNIHYRMLAAAAVGNMALIESSWPWIDSYWFCLDTTALRQFFSTALQCVQLQVAEYVYKRGRPTFITMMDAYQRFLNDHVYGKKIISARAGTLQACQWAYYVLKQMPGLNDWETENKQTLEEFTTLHACRIGISDWLDWCTSFPGFRDMRYTKAWLDGAMVRKHVASLRFLFTHFHDQIGQLCGISDECMLPFLDMGASLHWFYASNQISMRMRVEEVRRRKNAYLRRVLQRCLCSNVIRYVLSGYVPWI
jgi:hypothetical protein